MDKEQLKEVQKKDVPNELNEYDKLESREIIKEFVYTLNDFSEKANPKYPDKHRSYVYALCERVGTSLIPFYIGEGKGPRVWSHELETKVQNELLEKELKIELGEKEYEKELEDRKKELKKKNQKIEEIKAHHGEVVKYIIKWGMTSKEAFMAESALINLLKINGLKFDSNCMVNKNELTNIVRGHRSEGEKQTCSTEARTVEDFCNQFKNKPLYFEDLLKKKVKALLINIGNGYPYCIEYTDKEKRKKAIRDTACGNWRLRSIQELEKSGIEYVFATVEARIVGVYRIKKVDNKKFHYFYECAKENSEYPHGDDTVPFRNSDYEFSKYLVKVSDEKGIYPCRLVLNDMPNDYRENFIAECQRKRKKPEKEFNNLLQRKYMILEDIPEDDPHFSECCEYLYRRVIHTQEYVDKMKAEKKKEREEAIKNGKKKLPNPDTVTNNIYGSGNPIKYIEGRIKE